MVLVGENRGDIDGGNAENIHGTNDDNESHNGICVMEEIGSS